MAVLRILRKALRSILEVLVLFAGLGCIKGIACPTILGRRIPKTTRRRRRRRSRSAQGSHRRPNGNEAAATRAALEIPTMHALARVGGDERQGQPLAPTLAAEASRRTGKGGASCAEQPLALGISASPSPWSTIDGEGHRRRGGHARTPRGRHWWARCLQEVAFAFGRTSSTRVTPHL